MPRETQEVKNRAYSQAKSLKMQNFLQDSFFQEIQRKGIKMVLSNGEELFGIIENYDLYAVYFIPYETIDKKDSEVMLIYKSHIAYITAKDIDINKFSPNNPMDRVISDGTRDIVSLAPVQKPNSSLDRKSVKKMRSNKPYKDEGEGSSAPETKETANEGQETGSGNVQPVNTNEPQSSSEDDSFDINFGDDK